MSDLDPGDFIREDLKATKTILGLSKPTWVWLAFGLAFVAVMAVVFNVFG